ncbi:hypothetical protein D3C71_1624180 [compost metagenome]
MEIFRVIGNGHAVYLALHSDIGRKVQFNLGDDPQRAIATDGSVEQVGICSAGRFY